MVISFSSGTRRSVSKPLLWRSETNPDATMRLNLYSRNAFACGVGAVTVSDEAFHVAAYIWMAHAVHRSLCKDRLLYGVQKYSSVCDICLIFVLIPKRSSS